MDDTREKKELLIVRLKLSCKPNDKVNNFSLNLSSLYHYLLHLLHFFSPNDHKLAGPIQPPMWRRQIHREVLQTTQNQISIFQQAYLKQSFKLQAYSLRIFFPTPSLWHIVCMLDDQRHCPVWIQYQKLLCHCSPANSCYCSKNGSIPEQVATKNLHHMKQSCIKMRITLPYLNWEKIIEV